MQKLLLLVAACVHFFLISYVCNPLGAKDLLQSDARRPSRRLLIPPEVKNNEIATIYIPVTTLSGELLKFPVRTVPTDVDHSCTIIFVHGFPDDMHSFDTQLKRFSEDCHVFSPSLRGYHPWSQPLSGNYSVGAAGEDVIDIATYVTSSSFVYEGLWEVPEHRTPQTVFLVGHDWGSLVTLSAVTIRPELFKAIVIEAVPPLPFIFSPLESVSLMPLSQVFNSWYIGFNSLPFIPEMYAPMNEYAYIERLWIDWSPSWDFSDAAVHKVKTTLDQEGVLTASLAYYRQAVCSAVVAASECALPSAILPAVDAVASWVLTPGEHCLEGNRILSTREYNIPVLAVVGSEDGCIEIFDIGIDQTIFHAGVEHVILEGTGHFAHNEDEAAFYLAVSDFLHRHLKLQPGSPNRS